MATTHNYNYTAGPLLNTFDMENNNDDDCLPVYGYPGTNFYVIHISALISLSISIIISSGVLIYLLATKSLWKASTGKLLIFYFFLVVHSPKWTS